MLQYLLTRPPRELLLFAVLVVTTFTSSGLVAVWAGTRRRHWFWGTLLAVGLSAIPLIIPAPELVVLLLVQAVSTSTLLRLVRKRRGGAEGEKASHAFVPRGAQWSLRDLLLLTASAALVLALLTPLPRQTWTKAPYWIPWALGAVLLTPVGAWCGLGRCRGWLRAMVACLFFPVALGALFLHLVRPADSPRGRILKRVAAAVLALAILLPPLFILYLLSAPTPIPPVATSGGNGFAELVETAAPLAGVKIPVQDEPLQPLQAFVAQYHGVFDRAHATLKRPCYVPLRYQRDDPASLDRHVLPIEQLGRVFYAKALLAHREGRNAEAIDAYLDICRLGEALARGRLIWEKSNNCLGLEYSGIAGIAELRDGLSVQECQKAIAGLQQLEAQREPWEVVLARQMAWDKRGFHWLERLVGSNSLLQQLAGTPAYKTEQQLAGIYQARRQRLLGELALCCYQREHGTLPETLVELVPRYLSALPQDPFGVAVKTGFAASEFPWSWKSGPVVSGTLGGKPLIYRRMPTGYLLYSVGPDGKDDGGEREATGPNWQGDLIFDSRRKRR